MADLDKITDDLTAKAALAAGKDAAKRTVEDLLSSDEEKAQRDAERTAKSKSRRTKLLLYGGIGLLLVIGIFGMVVSYWQYFLLLGVLGLGGLYGWHRLRKRLKARKANTESQVEATDNKAEEPATKLRVQQDESEADKQEAARLRAAQLQQERARAAIARKEAEAVEEAEIDDELEAMKARIKK